ncbi:hypothetical protein LEN26_001625 [Aphanomyces euteiches]|nr:hypothetical protein LEN26_001625 [Aphanomyces euteiches]
MGFRGIFLRRSRGEGEETAKFHIVCAQAELCLLIERETASEIDPSGVVDAKVLLKNSTNGDLLSVTRMTDVTLEVGAMFWIADTTVHCFQFTSDNSYAQVQRAVQSLRHTEQLALMRSALSFHRLDDEAKTKTSMWKHYTACTKLDRSGADVRELLEPADVPKKVQAVPKKKNKVKADETSELPPPPLKKQKEAKEPETDAAGAIAFNTQLMVVIDPKQPSSGPGCHICLRRQGKLFTCPNGVVDHVICGRCLFHRFKLNTADLFERGIRYKCRLCTNECACSRCTQPPAPSSSPTALAEVPNPFPKACLHCSKEDAAILRPHPHLDKRFICTTCAKPLDATVISNNACLVCGQAKDVSNCNQCSKKCCSPCKLKLNHTGCPFCSTPPTVTSADQINPQDWHTYLASYVQFLIHRETRRKAPKLSEDSCFCCKDGGILIECDYKADAKAPRCPKVYHLDCLGFEVPDDVTWHCPRHVCGFLKCTSKSKFVCRYCVSAYCERHLPKEANKLFAATQDTPATTYIVCSTCSEQLQEAETRGLLPPNLYKTPINQKY